jgi:predicted CopG family antitoxin
LFHFPKESLRIPSTRDAKTASVPIRFRVRTKSKRGRVRTTIREEKPAKNIHTYNAYNMIMTAVKRIPVTEPVWKDLAEMRSAGQTYTDLLSEMIEDRKKRRLEEDVKKWSSRKKKGYVSLSEIKD